MRHARLLGRGLVALCFALPAALYTRLPDAMPTHFALDGRADRFVAKPWGPFVIPAIAMVAYALAAYRATGVRGGASRAAGVLPVATAAFCLFVVAVTLRRALGHAIDLPRLCLAATGLYLAVRGNYLGQLRRNWWSGIRTPWTLADAEVWLRTHRLAGWLAVLGGVAAFLSALAGAPMVIGLAPLTGALVVPAVYSYVVYRRVRAARCS